MLIETFLKNPSSVTGRYSQVCITSVHYSRYNEKAPKILVKGGFQYYFSWSQAAFLNKVAESILRNYEEILKKQAIILLLKFISYVIYVPHPPHPLPPSPIPSTEQIMYALQQTTSQNKLKSGTGPTRVPGIKQGPWQSFFIRLLAKNLLHSIATRAPNPNL